LETPVDDALLSELLEKFPDFSRAYDDDGMPPEEFIRYGGSVHTLYQFLDGYSDLLSQVRARMIL
jgi:transaldolase